jgi:WD40 repeat protein
MKYQEQSNENNTMIFDLAGDFTDALMAMPENHPRRNILRLMDEALRRDIHFIDRHPTTFFQCMWNMCWWYDCPEASLHYDGLASEEVPEQGSGELNSGLSRLMEAWRECRRFQGIQTWCRSVRPPQVRLETAELACFVGHRERVESAAFTSDRRYVVSGDFGGEVLAWNLQDNCLFSRHIFPGESIRQVVPLAGNGEVAVSSWRYVSRACNSGFSLPAIVRRYQVSGSGELTVVFEQSDIACHLDICAGKDNLRLLASTHSCTWRICVCSGEALEESTIRGSVIACSADGDRLVVKHCGSIRVLDTKLQTELFRINRTSDWYVLCATISATGCRIGAALSDGRVCVWDMKSTDLLFNCEGNTEKASAIAMSGNGEIIAVGYMDGAIRVWFASEAGRSNRLTNHRGAITSLSFAACEPTLLSTSEDRTVRLWRVLSGRSSVSRRDQLAEAWRATFSTDGGRVFVTNEDNGFIGSLDARNGQLGMPFTREDFPHPHGPDPRFAVSADRNLLAIGEFNGCISIWSTDRVNHFETLLYVHGDEVTTVAWTPDNRAVVSGCAGGRLLLNEVGVSNSGSSRLREIESRAAWVKRVAVSKDGTKTCAVWSDGVTRIIDSSSQVIEFDGTADPQAAADGERYMLVARHNESTVFDTHLGQSVAWFPFGGDDVAAHPPSLTWALVDGRFLEVFILEREMQKDAS